jgi:predicted ThiF/HesA family dinucleotide-utilizing enzyme
LVTEKQIHNLSDDVAVVKIGSGVRLTPLAGDAIRQAGIKIERVKT